MSLLLRNLQLNPLFDNEEVTPAGGGGSGELSRDDMIDFMADEEDEEVLELKDDKVTPKPKGDKTPDEEETPPTGDEEPPDELEELEQELEPPSEEQLELVTPVRRKDILAKYPTLFKDFPYLEKAYYREQQYTELLPTIDDAKAAVEKSEVLDRFEADVIGGGNTENILKAVREENPQSFYKIVDDYLPTLARVDEKAYLHVLGNVAKHTIVSMVTEARKTNNEALQAAAHILNQFVFGTSEFSPPTNLSKETPQDKTKNEELTKREQEFTQRQFTNAVTDLNTRVNNTLRNTIDANLDPKKSMTDYVRKNASRDALDSLETLIAQDARFKTLADKLWEKAFQEGFSKSALDRIKSAYLAKAKTLLPSVIKKARNDALRGMGRRVSNDEESTNKGPVPPGQPRSQQPRGKITKPSDIPKGMRTIDFLMQD